MVMGAQHPQNTPTMLCIFSHLNTVDCASDLHMVRRMPLLPRQLLLQ